MPSTAFARFWQTDLTRDCFLESLTRDDLKSMRLVSQDFASTLAPVLFKNLRVDFNSTSFSRHARIAALARIGECVKTFTFSMPHSDETFLPPLMNPDTLEEIDFIYEPQVYPSRPSSSSSASCESPSSKYGTWEINDLLVRQYPLLFHAATNIPSFIQAMKSMPNMRRLHISCPDQAQSQRYRRDIVDYALLSLRIAIEQSNPVRLETLVLDPVHPSATFYLRPQISIGTSPASTRVWGRIKTLNIVMDSFDYTDIDATTDHLKTLHTYLLSFRCLEHLSFRWNGTTKGPCPLSLNTEPCTTRPSSLDYSSCISHPSSKSSSTTSLSSSFVALRPLGFRRLKSMRLENAALDAAQASDFIMTHRKCLQEFDFKDCHLRSGTWDDALEPLTYISGNEDWKQKLVDPSIRPKLPKSRSYRSSYNSIDPPPSYTTLPYNEIRDVPLMLSPEKELPEMEFLKDKLWQDDKVNFFSQEDDVFSLSFAGSAWKRKQKGLQLLKKLGQSLGLADCDDSVRHDTGRGRTRRRRRRHRHGNATDRVVEVDAGVENVRKLLRGARIAWH